MDMDLQIFRAPKTPMNLLLQRCKLYDAPEDAPPVDVLIREGRIAAVGVGVAVEGMDPAHSLDAGGRILIPGLIDAHIHGAGGADVLDGSPEALRTMSRMLASLGTTAFVGTTFVWPATDNRHLGVTAGHVDADLGGARLVGLYLEGPFINPRRRGGLPPEAVHAPSLEGLDRILEVTGSALRIMTVAPELPGCLRIVERLAAAGVTPALGHSDATCEQARDGIAAGIRHVTHLFNAMPSLHHREPGPLIAIHEAEHLTVELISDDVHVNRDVVRWTRRIFGPERQLCITDSMRTAGLPDGRYQYGARAFEAREGAARYLDGTLIGTSLGLLEIVLRYQRFTGCSFSDAVDSASRIPARLLGLNKGTIAPGRDADLVLLDADRSVRATVVGGVVVYHKP